MTPFSIQNLIQDFIGLNSIDLVATKFRFCNDFEKELNLPNGDYSESIFDFLFNFFNNKKFFSDHKFKEIRGILLDVDYLNFSEVKTLINSIYSEIIVKGKDYFLGIMGINKFDLEGEPQEVEARIREKATKFHEIITSRFNGDILC